ncbi:MAG: DUF1330 domain-containing protein [Actinomycetota bacterium]|nr:DUF1330 domain-containing protein [Actinomycetota bacterium]
MHEQTDQQDAATQIGEHERTIDRLVTMYGEAGIHKSADDWRVVMRAGGDRPINLVNLLALADEAAAPDRGSGADAYDRYTTDVAPLFGRVGGRLVAGGSVAHSFGLDPGDRPDRVVVSHYPSATALADLWLDPDHEPAHHHRVAALRSSRVLLVPGQLPPRPPRSSDGPDGTGTSHDDRATAATIDRLVDLHGEGGMCPTAADWWRIFDLGADRPVTIVNLLGHEPTVRTPDGDVSGADAYRAYSAGIAGAFRRVGGRLLLSGHVRHAWGSDDAVTSGDARPGTPSGDDHHAIDAVVVTRYPSASALAAMWLDDEFVAAHRHRVAGVRRSDVHLLAAV